MFWALKVVEKEVGALRTAMTTLTTVHAGFRNTVNRTGIRTHSDVPRLTSAGKVTFHMTYMYRKYKSKGDSSQYCIVSRSKPYVSITHSVNFRVFCPRAFVSSTHHLVLHVFCLPRHRATSESAFMNLASDDSTRLHFGSGG